jgi:thiamine pyrophosphate-dependent acetolactate synthase large subunit-like protein
MAFTVADALALAVKRHGVTDVFGQSLPSAFFLAAQRQGLRQVSYRTENAGGAMADGYSRVTGKVSVIGAQNGPAATLLVAPFAEALQAGIPLVGLVQDVPRAIRPSRSSIISSCSRGARNGSASSPIPRGSMTTWTWHSRWLRRASPVRSS